MLPERSVSPNSMMEEEEHSIAESSSHRSVDETSSIHGATTTTTTNATSNDAGVAASADAAAEESEEIPKPKRPLSAYNMFFKDQREFLLKTLPQQRPEYAGKGHNKIGFQELARVIGAKWRMVDPQEKERYEKIAAQGREKYLEQTKLWKQQQKAKGLSTKRRKNKKVKCTKAATSNGNAKQSAFMQEKLGLSSKSLPNMMHGTGFQSGASCRTLSLPPHGPVEGMTASPSEFRTTMGPRVVSGIPNEIGAFTSQRYMNNKAMMGQRYVDQSFPSREHSASGPQSFMNFNQGFDYTQASDALPECMPIPFHMDPFFPEEQAHFDFHMKSDNTFPSFHPLDGFKQEANLSLNTTDNLEPLPIATPLLCDSFQESFPDEREPQYLQQDAMYSNAPPENLRDLAHRMGPDCVNKFVNMFGSAQDYY